MINPTQTPWTPLAPPPLDWQGDTPISRDTGDIYFSTEDGLHESDYVFIEGNRLRSRWATHSEASFVVAEIGVGSALNVALTCQRWLENRPAGKTLHYIGIERAPMRPADIGRALASWPLLSPVCDPLLDRWPDPLPGCHRRRFVDWGITIDFWWGEAAEILEDLASHERPWVDAWYLDGFAPATETGPWESSVYEAMAGLSRPGATFATFTAAGTVRRGLADAGFHVTKRPGYGRKREALCGHLDTASPRPPRLTPWDLNAHPMSVDNALVVGAGLAGAHVAAALAARGITVTVLEAGAMATGGSSNLQGITYTRLSHQHNPLTDFSVSAFGYATDLTSQLLRRGALTEGVDVGLGGYIQLHDEDDMLAHLREVLPLAPQFAQAVSADDIAARIGIAPRCGGIHYQRGGWLDPRAVCRTLLDHPLITVQENCGPLTLECTDSGYWQALNEASATLAEAPAAILATAYGVLAAPQLAWLPITPIRGQTTHLPSTAQLSGLEIALCDQGYLPPARAGLHCIGASFGPGDVGTDEREPEHAHNIDMMQSALPQLDIAAPEQGWQGHVAHRCNSNDYLPIAGMAPDLPAFNAQYDRLRHDRKRLIDAPAPLHTGLGVLTSLGSRGLTAAPLAAEVLADQLLGGMPCVPRYLQRATSPARFAERALKRGQAL